MPVVPVVTTVEVATLANEITADNFEAVVASLPESLVPVYLARLTDAATNIRALTKGLEQRLVGDGQVGQHWTIDGTEYGFFGSLQKGWKDIPNLIANLIRIGLSPVDLAASISELRVTDLRQIAGSLTDMEKRDAALELIEEARIPKGERGSPRFQAIDEKYISKGKGAAA
jgi:hypothetical protein